MQPGLANIAMQQWRRAIRCNRLAANNSNRHVGLSGVVAKWLCCVLWLSVTGLPSVSTPWPTVGSGKVLG